jgi:hypothetical protein
MPDNLGPLSLSKREHFAALILAGMCANSNFDASVDYMSEISINQADSLIEMLNGGPKSSDPEDLALDELRKDSHREYDRPSEEVA